MAKIIYEYLEKGKWIRYKEPKKTRQFGFFGTLTGGKHGEVHWEDGKVIRRASSQKKLFAWLHDNVPIPFWGDMGIERIPQKPS